MLRVRVSPLAALVSLTFVDFLGISHFHLLQDIHTLRLAIFFVLVSVYFVSLGWVSSLDATEGQANWQEWGSSSVPL